MLRLVEQFRVQVVPRVLTIWMRGTTFVRSNQMELLAQVFNVNIGAHAHVVGQVPADVVRVVVDNNGVRIPEPAVAKRDIEGRDVKVESSEPEAVWPAAGESPDVGGAEAGSEAAMGKGMVQVVVRVFAACIVAVGGR